MKTYLHLVLICWAILISLQAMAQPRQVTGLVLAQDGGETLPGAAVQATLLQDTTVWVGTVTGIDGSFELGITQAGLYKLEVRYLGYEINAQTVDAIQSGSIDLGTIAMRTDAKTLDAVDVQERAQRMTMEGDTAVFNADAFKVNRDADTGKLLEKMPGVTGGRDGLSIQGERVQRVLVDGKEFFGDDPKVALNTIPAEIVSKIQVYDQLSEQSQFSGFNDGNTIKTINIITKPGKGQGEFGKVFAGAGSDGRYLAGGNLNLFQGDRRMSILGLSNNVNQVNFATEDIAGAIGSTTDAINNPRRWRRSSGAGTGNADDFLLPPQNGINEATALGFNFSDNYGKKLKINSSYLFNTTRNSNDNSLSRTFLQGANEGQVYKESAIERSRNTNHRFNLRAEYEFDDRNSILIRPSVSLQDFSGTSDQIFSTTRQDSVLNAGTNRNSDQFQSLSFSNEVLYRHKFKKKGQTFSLSVQNRVNATDGQNTLLNAREVGEASLEVADDWQASRDLENQRHSVNFSFTQPLSEKVSLELGYRPEWEQSTSAWDTRTPDGSADYVLVDSALSNNFQSTFLTHNVRSRLRINAGKGSFAVLGINYEYVENENEQFFPSNFNNDRIYRNVLPFALFRKTFENKASLFMLYRASANLPSINQLNTVIDNSNPFQVNVGNVNLEQGFGHRFFTRFSIADADKGTNFFVFASGEFQQDRISNSTFLVQQDTTLGNGFVLPAGGQITLPTNLDGYYNFRVFSNYGFPVDALKSNLNLNATVNHNRIPGQVNGIDNFVDNTGLNLGMVLGSNISEKIDFTIGGDAAITWAVNSLDDNQNFNFQTYVAKVGGVFSPVGRWVLSSDFNYNIFRGLGDLDQEFMLWNAGIGYRMLKDESLELRLTGFDILGQNNSVQRSITETFVEDQETVVLQRYLMLSLSYRIRNFKGMKPPEGSGESGRRSGMN